MKVSDLDVKTRTRSGLTICTTEQDYEAAKKLILEYAESLNFDLEFQNFSYEIEHLEIVYGFPTGLLLLAKEGEEYVGCLCVRNLGDFKAEIKRMYVQPEHRRKGIGKKLLSDAMEEAKRIGYRFIRLDTIPDMKDARQLYSSMGFYEIEDYGSNPMEGTMFMEYHL